MTMTLADAFEVFKKNNPETTISFATFEKLKPAQVKPVSETSQRGFS